MTENAFITFVMDRTGSMGTMWDEALAGLNHFIKEQGEAEGDAWLTLISFDSEEITTHYEAWNCRDIPEITSDLITPRAMTPLLDATAKGIKQAESWLEYNDDWFNGKKIVVVLTDGYENASQEWTHERLKKLIEDKQDEGWEFLYLASNQDAWSVGSAMGFSAGSTMTYAPTGESIIGSYAAASSSVLHTRQTGQKLQIDKEEKNVRKAKKKKSAT